MNQESLLPVVGLAQSYKQLLVKSLDPLPLNGPVQDTAGPQHAPAQEQGVGQFVVMDILQEDQHHRVPAGLDDLVQSMMGRKPAGTQIINTFFFSWRPPESTEYYDCLRM